MKVTDLMVGDWIQVKRGFSGHLTNEKIKGLIDDDIELYPITLATGETVSLKDVVLIPLTEDILVRNGWDFRNRQYAIECKEDERGVAELSRDKDGYYWSINWDEYPIIRIHYVHELQHILRLCGIEKEIEL